MLNYELADYIISNADRLCDYTVQKDIGTNKFFLYPNLGGQAISYTPYDNKAGENFNLYIYDYLYVVDKEPQYTERQLLLKIIEDMRK